MARATEQDNPSAAPAAQDARRPAAAALLLLCLALASAATGQEKIDEAKAAGVKAAYLFNFLKGKFVKWPERALGPSDAPIMIGIFGDDHFAALIDETFRDKEVDGRPVRIRRIPSHTDGAWKEQEDVAAAIAEEVRKVHVLYVLESERRFYRNLLVHLKGRPVLTVSEIEDFAERGGMIEFVLREGRISLRINRTAAEEGKLRLSSRLLSVAEIVEPEKEP